MKNLLIGVWCVAKIVAFSWLAWITLVYCAGRQAGKYSVIRRLTPATANPVGPFDYSPTQKFYYSLYVKPSTQAQVFYVPPVQDELREVLLQTNESSHIAPRTWKSEWHIIINSRPLRCDTYTYNSEAPFYSWFTKYSGDAVFIAPNEEPKVLGFGIGCIVAIFELYGCGFIIYRSIMDIVKLCPKRMHQ